MQPQLHPPSAPHPHPQRHAVRALSLALSLAAFCSVAGPQQPQLQVLCSCTSPDMVIAGLLLLVGSVSTVDLAVGGRSSRRLTDRLAGRAHVPLFAVIPGWSCAHRAARDARQHTSRDTALTFQHLEGGP